MSGKPQTVDQHRTLCRARCEVMLQGMLGRQLAREWWDAPNHAFDDETPDQAWQRDYERVYRYVVTACR